MRYSYYYFCKKNPQIMEWLEVNNIQYHFRVDFVSFRIYSDQHNAEYLLAQLKQMPRLIGPTKSAEFTPKELSAAKYLLVTPRKQVIDVINIFEAYHFSCQYVNDAGAKRAHHIEQASAFQIQKEPSTKAQTSLWSRDNSFAEIFTDYRVRSLVIEHGLVGIEFKNVLLKDGSVSERIYQLTTDNIIMKDQIEFGHNEKLRHCPVCGKEQFFIDDAYQLHLCFGDLDVLSDLYKTERIFGDRIPYPVYIISQRFYQLLKNNKLASNVTFVPVVDISNRR